MLASAATYYTHAAAEARDRLRFENLAQDTQDRIHSRMETYIALLRATRGLFEASENVELREFRTFVQSIKVQDRYPGIQGIGFSRRISAEDKASFERAIAEERNGPFSVWPKEPRAEYHSIIFLEPLDRRNKAAIGYDMFTEPVRRAAMERACDIGIAAASGKVTLVQEIDSQKQAGFLIYVPVYRKNVPLETVEERREALIGFVYSPFRADDLLRGIGTQSNSEIAFQVYSGAVRDESQCLHRSDAGADSEPALYKSIRSIFVAGHPWTLSFRTLPSFEQGSSRHQSQIIFVLGLAISIGLFFITRAQVRARSAAERTAADLHRSDEALRNSEEKFRRLVELSPLGIFVASEGKFEFVNSALVKILGAAHSRELIGKPVLPFVHPDSRDALTDGIRRVETDGKMIPLREEKATRLDGTVVDVELMAVPFTYKGRPGAQVLMQDISERKSLELQLRQSQKMEAIGKLAGGVAHDFNNLLTAILGYSGMILDQLHEDAPLRNDIEEIKKSGERAASLTRQLLAFSRQQTLRPEVIDLNEIVLGLRNMLRRVIGEDIELSTVLGSELGRVKADPGQIEQVILNLVVNSRDAMPQGGRLILETMNADASPAFAQLRGMAPGPYVVLKVSDTGCGMTDEVLSHVFEPFFTTKPMGKGTGLGLSTVYGIVKQSGGYIDVESHEGAGTTFTLYLPRLERQTPVSIERAPAPRAAKGTETIVLVEDEPSVRTLAHRILKSQGYDVHVASSPAEALRIFDKREKTVHLLLTDIVMPHMTGRELAKRVTQDHPKTKVLYMSGYTSTAVLDHDSEVRRSLILKPFAPDTLTGKVREVLDKPV
jgi:PAS domain S-box-containing protein